MQIMCIQLLSGDENGPMDDYSSVRSGGRLENMRGVGRIATVLIALGFLAAACSSDGFTYVENDDEGLYFKVPDDWVVSESTGVLETPTAQLNRTVESLNDPELPALPDPWRVSIDADVGDGTGPSVLVEVIPVGSTLRDDISIRWLKSQATDGIDPTSEDAAEQGINVLFDQDLVQGDLSGNRVVIDWVSDNGTPYTVDQLVYFDPAITRLYRMVVLCDVNCYRANFDEIETVINSFTVGG